MAGEIKFPTNAEVFIHELKNEQELKDEHIRQLITDYDSYGTVEFTVGAAVGNSRNFAITQNGADLTKIDVGLISGSEFGGIGVTKTGKRVAILENKTWTGLITPPEPYHQFTPPAPPVGYVFATTDPYAQPLLQNSGNMSIPLTDGAYNYIWADFRLVVDDDPTTIVEDENDPIQLWYTKYIAGYEIYVVANDPSQPAGHPDALFLGSVQRTGTVLTIDMSNKLWSRRRGILVEAGTGNDSTIPSTYPDDTNVTFQDHIRARGTGVITNRNPHGVTAIDLGMNPDDSVSLHTQLFHTTGLTNVAAPLTNIATALYPALGIANNILIQPLAITEYLTIAQTTFNRTNAINHRQMSQTISTTFATQYDSGDATGLATNTYYFYIDATVPTSPMLLFSTDAGVLTSANNFIICSAAWNNATLLWSALVDYRKFNNITPLNLWKTNRRIATAGMLAYNRDLSILEYYNGSAWHAINKEFFSAEQTGFTSYTIAHGLGYAPDIVIVTLRSTGEAYESATPADATNVYITASGNTVKFKVYAKRTTV